MAALPGPLPAPARAPAPLRQPWTWRLRELVGAYLPLLLMGVLALGTWWLVRSTPPAEVPRAAVPPSAEPDYTMERFLLQRFGPDGRLRAQVEGPTMRHYPRDDRIEVDDMRLRAEGEDGSLLVARARLAVTDDRGTTVELRGGAEVTFTPASGGEPVVFRGEYLFADVEQQVVRSNRPVTLVQGRNRVEAAGLEADQRAQTVRLDGPVRATLEPPPRRP